MPIASLCRSAANVKRLYHNAKRHPVECEPMNEPSRRRPGILVLHKTLDSLEIIREDRSGLALVD